MKNNHTGSETAVLIRDDGSRADETAVEEQTNLLSSDASDDPDDIPDDSDTPSLRKIKVNEKSLASFGTKYQLVCLVIHRGMSPREALDHLGVNGSERWVRKLCSTYREKGVTALYDKRANNKSFKVIFSEVIKEITLAWWYARPAAGSKEIHRLVEEECKALDLRCPKYDVIKKFLANQPLQHQLVRRGEIHVWDKQARPVSRINVTTYSNQRWQLDHTRLKIWIREAVDGKWQPAEVYLSVALDAHPRAIAGALLSKRYPDSMTVALLLRQAILPKTFPGWLNHGIPDVVQPDRGPDFMSNHIALALANLGIVRDPDPPNYPDRKGKIERWFLTLDRRLRSLPGHMEAIGKSLGAAEKKVDQLLELHELREEILKFIVEYHDRTHSETGCKPGEMWQETLLLRLPESEQMLDLMLLKNDIICKVKRHGVKVTIDGLTKVFWSPQLMDLWRQEVRVLHNPDDLHSVLICPLDTVEVFCEAFAVVEEGSPYTYEDINRSRSQYRRGLLERQSTYAKRAEEFDRPRKLAARREEARKLLEKQDAERKATEAKAADESRTARALLERLERRGRGMKSD
jgi:putative transposase